MTTQTISSGVSGSGLTVPSGNQLQVLSGGSVQSTWVLSGGTEILSAGAVGSSDTVSSGGMLTLLSGAVETVVTVSSGGTLSGPGVLTGAIYYYGSVTSATVGSNYPCGPAGQLYVESGGVIETVVEVMSGGVARSTVVANNYSYPYAKFTVDFGGVASGTIISAGDANYSNRESGWGQIRGELIRAECSNRLQSTLPERSPRRSLHLGQHSERLSNFLFWDSR